jgi:hypothetical protein
VGTSVVYVHVTIGGYATGMAKRKSNICINSGRGISIYGSLADSNLKRVFILDKCHLDLKGSTVEDDIDLEH